MSTVPKHILFLCSYLHVPGGYEKAVVTTANLFSRKGYRVTLAILDITDKLFYPADPAIEIIQETLSFGITKEGNVVTRKIKFLSDVLKLRKIIKKTRPDYIIATEYPFAAAAVLAGAGKKANLLLWEHHHFGTVVKNSFWNFVFNRAVQRLHAVVCLNKDEKNHYLGYNKNSVVIPNFIEPPAETPPSWSSNRKFDLLTVTRFNHIKGIDLFMSVAKSVLRSNPDITWKVIGYGPQEEELKQFIISENLSRQLLIQKADVVDITKEYQQAGIFVMTSRNECFPLVLLEAMNNGLPCIAFDCDTGPRHIIEHGKTGLLIEKENTTSMADAIPALLNDPVKRKQMSDNAFESVRQFFPDEVYKKWEALFQSLSQKY